MPALMHKHRRQLRLTQLAHSLTFLAQRIPLAPDMDRGHPDWPPVARSLQDADLPVLEIGYGVVDAGAGDQDGAFEGLGVGGVLDRVLREVHCGQGGTLREGEDAVEGTFGRDIGGQLVQGVQVGGGARGVEVGEGRGGGRGKGG